MHLCLIYPFDPNNPNGFGIATYLKEFLTTVSDTKDTFSVVIPGQTKVTKSQSNITFYHLDRFGFRVKLPFLINQIHKNHPIDLIEICDFQGLGVFQLFQTKIPTLLRCHVPSFLIDVHCPGKKTIFSPTTRLLEKIQFLIADNIAFSTQQIKNELSKHIPIKKACFYYPPYYFLNPENAAQKKYNLSSDLKIVFVGRIEKNKGIDTLIKSVIYCHRKCKAKIKLHIIGPDTNSRRNQSYLEYLQNNIIKKYSNLFEFRGYIDHQNIPSELKKFDLFIIPSIIEGMGYSLLEAISAGLPAIGSKTGVIPTMIRHNFNGFVYHPQSNYRRLATYILHFYHNRPLLKSMGAASYNLVKQEFSPTKIYNKNRNIYLQIIEKQ